MCFNWALFNFASPKWHNFKKKVDAKNLQGEHSRKEGGNYVSAHRYRGTLPR